MSAPRHRVWRVGANVDTDQLAPGEFMAFGVERIAEQCLRTLRPDFARGVRAGDVLVAGPGFGIGSSREQAAAVLRHLGLAAVIAPSFGGLFFRNAFTLGLLLLTCAEASSLTEGERITIDTAGAHITREHGVRLVCEPVPGFLLEMARAGGLLAQLEQRFRKETP